MKLLLFKNNIPVDPKVYNREETDLTDLFEE